MTNPTDFRALCAELADAARVVRECVSEPCSTYDLDEALAAVDAALAQPEPQGIDRYELGDVIWRSWLKHGQDSWCSIADDALAVLPGLAQPELQGATDEEIEKRFCQWWHDEGSGMPPLPGMDHEEHARRISQIAWHNGAYVVRWGRPAIEPVPVAERLPGPEDCDAEGRCWFSSRLGVWILMASKYALPYSSWLPHHALPVPQ